MNIRGLHKNIGLDAVGLMSESESEYSNNPGAFDGESSTKGFALEPESADSEGTDLEMLEEVEMPTKAVGSSHPAMKPDTNRPSMSGCDGETAEVSIAASREGVLTMVTSSQLVPIAQPKGPVFGVDFLEQNELTEWELARI
ncbi:unnamed protein product [Prunus armeniaca]